MAHQNKVKSLLFQGLGGRILVALVLEEGSFGFLAQVSYAFLPRKKLIHVTSLFFFPCWLVRQLTHLIHFSQGLGVPQPWQSLKVLFPLDSSNSAKKLALRDSWGGGRVQRAGNIPLCEESGSEGHGHWGLPGCV